MTSIDLLQDLTHQQQDVYSVLRDFVSVFGWACTDREIAETTGIHPDSVSRCLRELISKQLAYQTSGGKVCSVTGRFVRSCCLL